MERSRARETLSSLCPTDDVRIHLPIFLTPLPTELILIVARELVQIVPRQLPLIVTRELSQRGLESRNLVPNVSFIQWQTTRIIERCGIDVNLHLRICISFVPFFFNFPLEIPCMAAYSPPTLRMATSEKPREVANFRSSPALKMNFLPNGTGATSPRSLTVAVSEVKIPEFFHNLSTGCGTELSSSHFSSRP